MGHSIKRRMSGYIRGQSPDSSIDRPVTSVYLLAGLSKGHSLSMRDPPFVSGIWVTSDQYPGYARDNGQYRAVLLWVIY